MTINSVMSSGLSGLQASQREMVKAAEDIASAALPVRAEAVQRQGMAPDVQPGVQPESRPSPKDLVESLVELKRQEHVFTASAKIVSVADKTLGSLIDVTS